MIGSHNLSNDAREVVLPVALQGADADIALRVYPPDSGSWYLRSVRHETLVDSKAGTGQMTIKDPSGNALHTALVLSTVNAQGDRGSLTLTGTDAQRTIHGSGAAAGPAYHEINVIGEGGSGFTGGGIVQLWLYYRRLKPSGGVSSARIE